MPVGETLVFWLVMGRDDNLRPSPNWFVAKLLNTALQVGQRGLCCLGFTAPLKVVTHLPYLHL